MIPNGLDLKEYKKEWNKLCRSDYKEVLNDKDRKYYAENKERLSEKNTCECSCIVLRDSMTKHKRTQNILI